MTEAERLQLLKPIQAACVRLGADLLPGKPPLVQFAEGLTYAVGRLMRTRPLVRNLAARAENYLPETEGDA